MLQLRRRLAALAVATALGLVAAVSLTAAPAAPEPPLPSPTGDHHGQADPPADAHADHRQVP